MSLFARILSLSDRRVPTEDVLTEVVVHLFRLDWKVRLEQGDGDRAAVLAWLRSVGVLSGGPVVAVRVETQRSYGAITGHETVPDHAAGSRPDIVVEIDRKGNRPRDVVLVESKVDSLEGEDQLARYAGQLQVRHANAQRALVYLTRDYDPRDRSDVCATAPDVDFTCARWHGVYAAVRDARSTAPLALLSLYNDVLEFLTSLGMDRAPRFTPADALALTRAPTVFSFLDDTLRSGSPSPADRMAGLLGRVNRRTGLSQVRTHRRYPIYRTYGKDHGNFEVLLGYRFPDEGFPQLFLGLNSYSEAAGGGGVAQAIRSLEGRGAEAFDRTWQTFEDGNWAGAMVTVPLGPFLSGDEHVGPVRATLHKLLDELERIMSLPALAVLPWRDTPSLTEDEDE